MIRFIKYLSLLFCSFCLLSTSFSSASDISFASVYSGFATTDQLNSQNFEPKMYTLPSGFDPSGYSGICVYYEYSFSRQLLSTPSKNNAWSSSMPHVEFWSNDALLGQSFLARKPNQDGVVDGVFSQLHCFEYNSSEVVELPFSAYFVTPLASGKGYLDYLFYDYKFYKSGSSTTSSDCSHDSNYLQCIESLNSANGAISTLSGSLNSCQSDLANCTNGNDVLYQQCVNDKENCLTALSSLSGQYISCVNYSSSLSDQLQESLSSAGSGDLSSVICNTYDLNWYDSSNNILSVNIDNSLRLPRGYMGYLSEGVLGIKPINTLENAVSIDDEDFQKVMNSYGVMFLFLFSSGLFLMFLFVIRKYFIGLKS